MSLFDQDGPDPVSPPSGPSLSDPPADPGPGQPAAPQPDPEPHAGSRRSRRRLPRTPPDGEFIEVKAAAGPLRKLVGVLVVFGFVIGAALGGAYWWYRRQVDPPGPQGLSVSVSIVKGSSTNGIGKTLEKAGVIANSTLFTFYVRRKNAGPFEAGQFVLRKHSDFDSTIRILERGPVPPRFTRVNIPEGLTLSELTVRLHDGVARFRPTDVRAELGSGRIRSSLRTGAGGSWEGLLFPASYDVGARTELRTVLSQMAEKMEHITRLEGIGTRTAAVAKKYRIRLTPTQMVTVASLIQEEAGNTREAPKIATVIYNRLRQGIPLGIDATSRYLAKKSGKPIDFTSRSPYNTRRVKGLPPTPIAAPGRDAIHAALNPATGPWIYYVLTAPGRHTFAETDAQFLAAKEICKAKALGCG